MKSPWNDHVILQGTGLHRNKLAWDWRHRSEEQRVRSVRESNIHKGLWRWTSCRSLQVVLYQSSRVILSYPPIFMNFPQQAICSSCKWMCINSPLPCKSLVTKGRKKRDYVKRDNMQIELVIKENIWEIKIFQSWLYCPPALSCLWTLVLGDQMLMDRMSVLSLLSCGVSLSLSLFTVQLILHYFLYNSRDSQSSPSYSPVPWVAQVDWMCHCGFRDDVVKIRYERMLTGLTLTVAVESMFLLGLLTVLLRRECRPSLSVSSLTVKALGRSCLLANTSRAASFNSSSDN